jgi:ketopantoate reductase
MVSTITTQKLGVVALEQKQEVLTGNEKQTETHNPRSTTHMSGLTDIPKITVSQQPKNVVIQGAGGQGVSMAVAALQNAEKEGYNVVMVTRRPAELEATNFITSDGKTIKLSDHPKLIIRSTPPDNTEDNFFLNATDGTGFAPTMRQLPQHAEVFTTQNGVPPSLPSGREDLLQVTGVSKIISGSTNATTVQGRGGALQYDENSRMRGYIETVFSGNSIFSLDPVEDVKKAQFEKIALNTALNTTCTLFGMTKEELMNKAKDDPRVKTLIYGIAKEAVDVGRAAGASVEGSDVKKAIEKTIAGTPKHPTSMKLNFDDGKPIEIQPLPGGVSELGKKYGLQTPLCEKMAATLGEFQTLRDEIPNQGAGVKPGVIFRENFTQLIEQKQEELLALAKKITE